MLRAFTWRSIAIAPKAEFDVTRNACFEELVVGDVEPKGCAIAKIVGSSSCYSGAISIAESAILMVVAY